jgi:glucosylceramidase
MSIYFVVKMKKYFCFALFVLVGVNAFFGCRMLKKDQFGGHTSDRYNKAAIYTTAQNTDLRLAYSGNIVFMPITQPNEADICVFVEPHKFFQTIVGFGSAITDASAETFAKLPINAQNELIRAFYDTNTGIGYSLMRTNINSCDFSSDSYTYVSEGDKALETFSIEHDKRFKLPMIKRAFEVSKNKMTLFASPWSPPAFMKDNNQMLQGGKLLPDFYQPWANYFVKFIKAYQAEGIPVWGVTIQNEPMAVQKWESCVFTAEEERDFLKYNLGPTFEKEGMSDVKIIVWDHNRDFLGHRASVIFDDRQAAKYAWGIGYHWYEKWSGGESLFDNVDRTVEMFPDKSLLFTEGCVEKLDS